MTTHLDAYFDRVHYTGPAEPTLDTLRAVHRAHVLSIPYENLDMHLGRAHTLDHAAIFDKLVRRRRGGWCFEMNGLLAWALREIGFDVALLASAVGRVPYDDLAEDRARDGNQAEGNHMVLLVHLDRPWLADVGFGNGLLEPLPLAEGEYEQGGLRFRLARRGERWRCEQYDGIGFDFTLRPHTMDDFAARCHWLQTAPESGFTRTVTCHRWRADGIYSLRGAVLRHVTAQGSEDRVLTTEADYRRVLRDTFGLDLGDEVTQLWSRVWQAHQAWLTQSS